MLKIGFIKLAVVLVTIMVSFGTAYAQNVDLTSEKEQEPFGNLDKTPQLGHVVYGRQPDEATIPMLKERGFTHIVSVRYDDEPANFDARKVIEDNGMTFTQISYLKGSIKDPASERTVDDASLTLIKNLLEETANNDGKVLLHCASGQRAAAALGSILYRDYGYSKDDARAYAEKAGLTSKNTGAIYDRYIEGLNK